jgi:hypothetical protein
MNHEELDVAFFDEEMASSLSDEALEALDSKNSGGAYTLGACTGLSVCPA